MSIEPDNPEVMNPLNELIDRAIAEKKWLHHNGLAGSFWLSPQELREQNKLGKFRWSPCNWELREPIHYLNIAKAEVEQAQSKLDLITNRVTKWMLETATK